MSLFINDREIKFTSYPNGETVVPVMLDIVRPHMQRPVVRLHWESDQDLVRLVLAHGLVMQVIRQAHVNSWPALEIDYMPYSRMDREQDGHCFSLKYIAKMIRALQWESITVVEPHSDVTLYELQAQPRWLSPVLVPKVMHAVGFDPTRDYLVLPDAGAFTRYAELIPEINTSNVIVLKKDRDFETGKIRGLVVDYRLQRGNQGYSADGCKALIVDDLSSRGGTFVGAAQLLRATFGFAQVHLYVTHMEPAGLQGELRNALNRVFITDTISVPRPLPENFEIFTRSDYS